MISMKSRLGKGKEENETIRKETEGMHKGALRMVPGLGVCGGARGGGEVVGGESAG